MSKLEIELNRAGVAQLLKSQEIADICRSEAQKIASRCGSGYSADTYNAGTRVIASAYTETEDAMKDNTSIRATLFWTATAAALTGIWPTWARKRG